MTQMKKYVGILLLVIALLAVGIVSALSQKQGTGERQRGFPGGCLDQLTEEQREALNQIIEELRDAGATHEEIREAIQQFLEEQGIDTEECLEMKGPGEPGERRFMGCFDQLTEEQREALNQIIEELRDAGATPEEIREAVQQFLEEQGIDTGNWQGMKGHGQRGFPRGCLDQLTEEQREALNQIIEELRDSGATPEEIREAVQQFLEEQGIDTEECFGAGHKRGQDGN